MDAKRTVSRVLACLLVVAPLVVAPPVAATAGPGSPPGSGLAPEPVPYPMDDSNQAGWWHPVAEHDGHTYVAFNAPSPASAARHQVRVAVRAPDGQWSAGCLQDTGGACVDYPDDIGHNQPTIAIDGDGHIHAFVSMHNDPWRYFRSALPGSVETMMDRSGELPDQDGGVTYPVAATAPRGGDVYLLARVNVPGTGHTARLYRWRTGTQAWQREAVLTPGHLTTGYVPYPDDIQVDNRGHVHLAWEWAQGSTSNLRYYGSYLVYRPAEGRAVAASGDEVALPVTPDNAQVVYEPRAGAVQSARFALVHHTPHLAGIAYRYRPTGSDTFEVRWATWDGQQWVSETVDAGGFDSFAALAVTHHRGTARVYYVQHPTCDPDQELHGTVFAAEKRVTAGGGTGQWQPRWLGGEAGVERLAAVTRADGTDVLYLAAPRLEHPTESPGLYLGTLRRIPGPAAGGAGGTGDRPAPAAATGDRMNWALGAPVSVTSALNETSGGECAVDGNTWGDHSRWLSGRDDPEPAVTITFAEPIQVDEVHLHSGYRGGTTDIVEDFAVDLRVGDGWQEVAQVTGNTANPAVVRVDDLSETAQLRLRVLHMEHPNHLARVYEVEVYSRRDAPPLTIAASADPPLLLFPGEQATVHAELSNRSSGDAAGTLVVDPPAGWTADPPEVDYHLAPGETIATTVTVTAPPDAPAGPDHQVVLRAAGIEAAVGLPVRGGVLYSGDGSPYYQETGPWAASGLPGHADSTSRYAQGGTGAAATWTPDLPRGGTYQLHAWFPGNPTTTTAAQYTVTHAGGTATLTVDQSQHGGDWYLLGEWDFPAGSSGSVTLTAVADGHHRANAVWFTPVEEES